VINKPVKPNHRNFSPFSKIEFAIVIASGFVIDVAITFVKKNNIHKSAVDLIIL
jgi:hypothetical protein